MSGIFQRSLFCCLAFFALPGANAQQLLPIERKAYADSLHAVLASRVSDSLKASANFLLSDYWRSTDSLKSRAYLREGKVLGDRYPYWRAAYFFYEGQLQSGRNKHKAARYFKMAQGKLLEFNGKGALLLRAAAWYNEAIALKDAKGYPYVMDVLSRHAIPLAKQSGDTEKLAHYYSQFGTILMYNAQFEQAELYNKKAISLLEKEAPRSPALLLAYISASNNFIYSGQRARAKTMLDAARRMADSASYSACHPLYYLCEAQYYLYVEDFPAAISSTQLGITAAKSQQQTDVLQLLYFRNYESLLQLKRYGPAKKQLLDILAEGNFTKDVNNRKTIYSQLASINEALSNEKEAYSWLKRYSALSDSLSDIRHQETVTELEAKYQNSENRNQIAELKSEKSQQDLEVTEQKNYVLVLAGISMLLFIAALFSYLYYRNNRKLILQNELIYQKEIETRIQAEKLTATKAMLEGEEKERERIAKELHDGLGGMLAGVKFNLSGWASRQLEPQKRGEFDGILMQLDRAVGELRGVARNLMPESLLRFGLETALKDLCEFFMNDGLEIDLQTYSIAQDLPLAAQLNIYRIVQELISNAVRHAQATAILLQCSQSTGTFFITVEDNGIGFSPRQPLEGKGMGLGNIANRVEYHGGTLEINAEPGQGTTVNIELNLNGK